MALLAHNLEGYTLQDYSDDGFREHWRPLDWLTNHFKARGCYATPIIQFFQEGRFKIQIDPKLESTTQPRLGGYSLWTAITISLPYNLDFKTDELDHLPASWQFKYYWRLLQAILEDAQELLEEASRLLELHSTTKCSEACRAYTSDTHTWKDKDGLLLEFLYSY
jgi:hypothetical protein